MIHHNPSSIASRVLLPNVRWLVLSVVLLLTAQCALLTALGQSASATLSGTVEDERGAVIPGVSVTAVNKGTQLSRMPSSA